MQEIPKNNIQIINNGEKSYDEKKTVGRTQESTQAILRLFTL